MVMPTMDAAVSGLEQGGEHRSGVQRPMSFALFSIAVGQA